jgi:hypothetical protein
VALYQRTRAQACFLKGELIVDTMEVPLVSLQLPFHYVHLKVLIHIQQLASFLLPMELLAKQF